MYFDDLLKQSQLSVNVREATLSERAKMMSFHMMLLGAMMVMMFVIVQWLVSQYMVASLPPPLTSGHASARVAAVNTSSLMVSAITIFCLALISKTPLTYMIFGARVVDARTLGEIGKRQAALRCVIKTLTLFVSPLAIFYLIRYERSNFVDHLTKTRVILKDEKFIPSSREPGGELPESIKD